MSFGALREPLRVYLLDVGVTGCRQHAHTLPDQRVAEGVLRFARGKLRRARARFGDTIRGHRVVDAASAGM